MGETELSVSTLPSYVLHYLLRNTGPRLRELILAVRSALWCMVHTMMVHGALVHGAWRTVHGEWYKA